MIHIHGSWIVINFKCDKKSLANKWRRVSICFYSTFFFLPGYIASFSFESFLCDFEGTRFTWFVSKTICRFVFNSSLFATISIQNKCFFPPFSCQQYWSAQRSSWKHLLESVLRATNLYLQSDCDHSIDSIKEEIFFFSIKNISRRFQD